MGYKCREYGLEKQRNYYAENKARLLEQKRVYYQENKDKIMAYREANKEVIALRQKEYDAARSDDRKQYYTNNKDRLLGKQKVYRKENRKKIDNYFKSRRSVDKLFDLVLRVRASTREAFRRKGWKKSTRTQEILGCDFNTLQNHLILSAIRNYGVYIEGSTYHIDHIIPVATAKTEEEVIALNHYTNLQYLLPEDNMKKGSKLNWALSKE